MEADDPIELLFVDDDTRYMAVVQHLLTTYKARHFTIHWRQHAHSALEVLRSGHTYDLVLLDYYLPERNGLELAREIREAGYDVPVAFFTAHRDFSLAVEGLKLGVVDYLVKDSAIDALLPQTIVTIVDRLRLGREFESKQKAALITQQQSEAVRELVVTICHEFNNPLAAVKISTDILLRQDLPALERELVEELDRNIESVDREITRLREITFDDNQREDSPTV
jgi:DNA-binding NtrC family response regulator